MTNPKSRDDIVATVRDLDHEISQLLRLHWTFRRWWYPLLPDTWRRAMRVAYSIHWRVLIEFGHDSRPSRDAKNEAGCAPPDDLRSSDLFGRPVLDEWTQLEILRLCDADQLSGHLSKTRQSRRGLQREWGDDEDWKLVEPVILAVLNRADLELPRARRAWQRAR